MGLLDQLWDDHVGGPAPDRGLGKLRHKPPPGVPEGVDLNQATASAVTERQPVAGLRNLTQGISIGNPMQSGGQSSGSPVGSPAAGSPMPTSPLPANLPPGPASKAEKEDVWRSVFNPGQNKSMKKVGSAKFDNPTPESPSVYDWLYNDPKSKNQYR